MKIAIIYHSKGGNTKEVSQIIAEGAKISDEIEIKQMGLIGHMLIRGMLAYSAGCTKEGPITHYGAVTIKNGDEWQKRRAMLLGKRVAEKAIEIFGPL